MFKNIQLPTQSIGFGAVGGPGFSTEVVTLPSGHESRNQNWIACRCSYDFSFIAKTHQQFKPLKAFFMVMGGRAHSWPFKDWDDHEVVAGEGAVRPLTATTFQLVKRYTYEGYAEDRDIGLPLAAGFVPRVAGVPLAGGAYTLDPLTGILAIPAGPDPETVAWVGQFLVRVRFDTDTMPATTVNKHGDDLVLTWDSVPVVEVRPEQ